MVILGLNTYHADSSACLVINGKLVAAAEEERFNRIKHWAGFPSQSIHYCLSEAGLTIADIDHIAINSDPNANFSKKFFYLLLKRPSIKYVMERLINRKKRTTILDEFRKHFPEHLYKRKIHHIEHHLCHLSSAFYVSPFKESVVVSIDGFGDFSSASWAVGNNGNLAEKGRVYFPHSLGIFYQALTQYLGFPNYGDEYKVMGLAPYGEAKYLAQMKRIVNLEDDGSFTLNLNYFRHHRNVELQWSDGTPSIGTLYSTKLEELLGPARKQNDELTQFHKDIARSVQAMYEEAFFHLLNVQYEKYQIDNLCIAGGCGMNSVANGRIHLNTKYKHVYVQSASGDAGGAIGAAFTIFQRFHHSQCEFFMEHAYWGSKYSNDEIEDTLQSNHSAISDQRCTIQYIESEGELCKKTAFAISEGKVIGWFQGRMEWGPRALGNRSILSDPRRTDMKDILNLKIKRRESFRPFAPSILRSHVSEWFEHDDEVPFMMKVFQIQEKKRALVPAVTHADGSGRLQTVCADTNARYHALISEFHKLTGIPMLLNTSFNENEPVVCTPQQALDCFLRTKMDFLVLGNWIVYRKS